MFAWMQAFRRFGSSSALHKHCEDASASTMSDVAVTKSMVLGRTRAPDLGSVRKLNLFGSGVNAAGVLAEGGMTSLQALSASCNELDDEALAGICKGCPGLEELYLRGNRVSQLATLGALAGLSRLRIVWLAHNPVCTKLSERDLRTFLCHIAGPGLEILDNEGECAGVSVATENCCAACRWAYAALGIPRRPPLADPNVRSVAAVLDAEKDGTCPRDDSASLEEAVKAAASQFPSLAIPPLPRLPQSRRVPAAGIGSPEPVCAPFPAHAAGRSPAVARRDLIPTARDSSKQTPMAPPAFPTGRPAVPVPGAWAGPGPTGAANGGRDGLDSAASRALARSSAVRAGPRQHDDNPARAMLTAVMALVDHLDGGSLRTVRARCDALLSAGGAGRPSE